MMVCEESRECQSTRRINQSPHNMPGQIPKSRHPRRGHAGTEVHSAGHEWADNLQLCKIPEMGHIHLCRLLFHALGEDLSHTRLTNPFYAPPAPPNMLGGHRTACGICFYKRFENIWKARILEATGQVFLSWSLSTRCQWTATWTGKKPVASRKPILPNARSMLVKKVAAQATRGGIRSLWS